ncbi:MAG: peptide chain release factor N(5)-glutamine methyltransferase [Deltaproteobacteria bacterium]|nr:peptide chain release factor N(5)-glutamine methyltransferase [Deltaproteobacteria bacterium]
MPETWTILGVLSWTTQYFGEKKIASPRLDAEVLLSHVLHCDRVGLYVRFEQPLERGELDAFRELVRRRAAGEPVAYLTGTREFWSLPLRVDPRVLIPRLETELVVDVILEVTRDTPAGLACDVGTGSGAIALALKRERPAWTVVATDVSAAALEVARENAARLAIDVEFLEGDMLRPLAGRGPFDVIASNPPYVAEAEVATLMREVAEHEPRVALTPGGDGLAAIRQLVGGAPALLGPAGALVLEIGYQQGPAVRSLVAATGAFGPPTVRRDHAGLDRVLCARRLG